MYEFDRSTPVTVALRARSGEVAVHASDRDTVQVDVQPMGGGSTEEADRTRVVLEGDTLLIQVPGDGRLWRRSGKLRIDVRVPSGSSLTGKSAAADVRVTGRHETVKLDVASADVDVEHATGDVVVDGASSDIRIGRVGGALKANTSSGDVRVGDVTGDAALDTASGDIRLDGADHSVRAHSASGTVTIGRLRAGRADVRTASGDIRVGVAPGTGVWLDLSTASGRSTGDLTPQGETEQTGTLELRIRSASGDIHVHRAVPDEAYDPGLIKPVS